jgi:competence ComEA-like helix-hairpin-helix protein
VKQFVAGVIGIAVVAAALARGSAQEKNDKAEKTFTTVCTRCHPAEKVLAARRTPLQWEEVITTMKTTRGAPITDEEFDVVYEYLVREHGRVEVNRAPAEDLAAVLEIPEQAAETIVSYRKEHGAFKDLDALLKVPGLDAAQLKKKKEAIAF